MPTYQIAAPNGLTYQIDGPAGASQDDVVSAVLKQHPEAGRAVEKAPASIRDTAVSLAQGVVGAGKSLSDVFGADTALSGALGNIQQSLGESYTPERQAEQQRRAATTEAAAKSGNAMEEISAFLGGVKEAPLQSLMQGMGSLAPYLATGLVGLGAKTVTAVNQLVGLAQGAGTIKGTTYDNVKAELIRQRVSPEEAEARAVKAQETLGENFLNIAAGAMLGAAGARFGVESLLSKAGAAKANANLLPRVGTAIAGEVPLEGAQAGQEQYASNVALQREGIDTPAFQGVLGAAARDAAIGAMTAGTVGAMRGPGAPPNAPGTQQAQGAGSIGAIPQEPIVPVAPVPEDPLQAPFEVSAEDVTRRLQEEYVKRNSPADPATQAQIDVKQAELDKRAAEIADMQSRFKSLSPGDRAYLKNKRKSNAKLAAEIEALKATAPEVVAPKAAAPKVVAPKAAAPAATPLKIVRQNEPVVAPAIDPATLLSQPYTPTGTRTVLRDGEPVRIYDKEKPITDPDTGVLVQKTIYKGKEAYTPITELSEVPDANANATGLAAPAKAGSTRLAKSDGVPVSPTSTGGSSAPNAGGLGVGANQQPAGKLDEGKGAQQGALKEEPYTFIKPSAGYDSFAKYAFKDENGVKYNISLNGDIHVELPPKLKSKFDNVNAIIFRNGDPRRNVYPADKLPLFVPPTVKDAIYAHVSHTALNGMGVDGIKKAVDATYAKRKGEEKTSSLKATVVKPTAEEAAKQAVAEKQKQDQLAAIPKRVIKKSETGQAAADAKEAKRLAKKEADAAASAAAFQAQIDAANPEPETAAEAVSNESDITKSVKALEAATTSKKGIEQFRNHLDFLTSDSTGKAQRRIPNWVTEEQIAASIRRNDYLAGRGNVRGEVDLVVRIDKLTDTLSDIDSRFKNAVEDDDTALQTALTSRREAVEAELTDLKKSAKAQGIDLSAPRIDTRHIRTPRGSQGEPAEPTGNTRAAIVTSLKSAFKTSANFDALVTVVQEEGDLPPDVLNDPTYRAGTRGVAYEGKVYLVANNIPQGRELGVFLHEAGAHIGFDRVLSDDARRFLADKVRQWSKEGDVKGTAAKEALRKGGRVDDEVIAYMVEELVNAGVTPTSFRPESSWLRRVYAAFNKFLKNIGMRGEISPQDLVDAAYGAAHLEMNRGELTGLKFITARGLEAQKVPSEKVTKFREAAGLKPTEKISRATTAEGMDEVQAVKDQEIGAPKENTRLTGYNQVTPAPRVNINTDNGNVEIIADGKVVHSVPFANPKLISAYKGDTRDRVIKEASEKITDSDEFQRVLNKAHDAWMETQPYNSYEQRFLALMEAAKGYDYEDKYINSILANSNGGTMYNIRPSMRRANESIQSAASGGRSQQQIIKDIEKVAPIGIGTKINTRFSVANPAILAGQSTADYLFRGPSAPRSLLDRAAETASGVRQNMANKLEWWMDKATRVYGNAATDATGEAALRDRIEAGSKVSHIALNKLLLGGLEKKNGFWQAVKTDASYQDMLNELEKAVGKYDGVNNFADINRLFDFAATARREQELIKAGKMAWQTSEGIQPTLDAGTQARGVTPQMDEGMRIYNGVPEIKTALDIFERFNNRGVDAMVTAGVIDAPTAAGLKGNAGYVPWFRISQDKDGNIKIPAPKDYAKGLVNLSNMRDLEGAKIENFQINHVLDNMAQLSGWMTSKTIGNDTAAYMVDFATKFGVAGKPFAKKVGRAQANSVQVMQNGVPTYYAFDDPMAIPAFRGYESAHSAITEFLSAPANLLRLGVTAFPVFSVSQLPQDAMRAFIESDLKNPYALIPRIMGNFVKELIGGGTASGKRLAQFGIVGRGGDIMPGEASRSIRQKLGHYDSGMGATAKKFWAGLERVQAASDAASRTALYELTMKETGNEALAIRKAREIINFDTQGVWATSTFLRQTVPFMGVTMVGLNNLYKGLVLGQRLSDKEASAAKRSIIYHGTQIAVLTMLYTMLVGDTDDYKKLGTTERNRNFIIPGTGMGIPVPGDGLGYIFKVIPEQITRYTLAEGLESKDMGSKAGRALWEGFSNIASFTSFIPVIGSPLPKTYIELTLNQSYFTGNPIVGKSKEHLDPADQYTDSTSEIAKQLGKAMNLSPLKLDYIVRAMGGQMGGFVMAMADAAVNSAQGKVTPSWDIRSFPGLNAFTYPDGKDRAALEDFYELRGLVDKVARTYTDMANTGRGKEGLAYLAEGDNKRAYALRQFQTQAELGLAKFRRVRTLILNDTTITDGAEMKRRLKELDEKENAYLKSMRLPDRREFAQLTPSFDPSILKAFR